MDGVGLAPSDKGNAVGLAHTPTLDWLFDTFPHVELKAHGTAVGLPSDADMGNSEVGHNALGAGRVFDQGAKLVNQAIENRALFDTGVREQIRAANLRAQMQRSVAALRAPLRVAKTDVSAALNAFVRQDRRRHSNLLFVVSDFLTSDGGDLDPETDWRDAIKEIRQNIVPVIVSFRLADSVEGLVRLCDAERPRSRLVWFNRDRIRRINREERRRVKALVHHFRAAGLDSITLTHHRDIDPQLVHLARVRRRRKF
jgi:hypothetical protein